MPLYKCHERGEHRDDAMILAAENPTLAAEQYGWHLVRIDADRYGPGWETDYVVLVREPGGAPKWFNVLTDGLCSLIVREWVTA